MGLKELRAELDDEVSSILDSTFSINVTTTDAVPHSEDSAITFPNLDTNRQGAKLISTCVLYIDIRRSTDLNFSHRATTVAKLYSAFVRAMTRVAVYHKGHVRGIIGDRVMVLFDAKDAFANAVECAISMNTVSQYIINKHFKANEVVCGIGIDAGKMLATKTGMRRHGFEQTNYRNLVWLGRPANVASKLTDIANKPTETASITSVSVAYDTATPFGLGLLSSPSGLGLLSTIPAANALSAATFPYTTPLQPYLLSPPPSGQWHWIDETPDQFLSKLTLTYAPTRIVHNDPRFQSFFLTKQIQEEKAATPPILMTEAVWRGFRAAKPDSEAVKQSLFNKINVSVPGNTTAIYGGNVIFPDLRQ
jgi:adenylate cyclase